MLEVYLVSALLCIGSIYTLYSLVSFTLKRSSLATLVLIAELAFIIYCLYLAFSTDKAFEKGVDFLFVLGVFNFLMAFIFLALRLGKKRINKKLEEAVRKRDARLEREALEEEVLEENTEDIEHANRANTLNKD